MGERTYAFDANLQLADNAAPMIVTGYAQAGGANGIVDLGGNQGVTITQPGIADVATLTPQQARFEGVAVIDITALDIASNDERYTFKLLGSNKPDFSSVVAELGDISTGKGSAGVPVTQSNGVVGRLEILFTNEQMNVKYQYVALYVVIAGTTPTISFSAFIAELPEV